MLNILALLSRSKLHCFSHPSQRFGATRCNASPHNSWRNRPPHSAIEGLPADNGNYSVTCAYLQTPTGLREFENCFDGRPDHVDFKFKFNAQTAVEGFRNM